MKKEKKMKIDQSFENQKKAEEILSLFLQLSKKDRIKLSQEMIKNIPPGHPGEMEISL